MFDNGILRHCPRTFEMIENSRSRIQALCATLEQTWHREIPVSAAMNVRVDAYRDSELRVSAGFEENRNLHGTAFAGSLYSICVLTGWGSVWLALQQNGIDAHIVVRRARIEYKIPVIGRIQCRCRLAETDRVAALADLYARRKCRLELVSEVLADDRPAVRFDGVYVIIQDEPGA